jgi:hypothetical protein
MGPRPIVFKKWRDTRIFSNLKSTHCTLLILLIINLVTKKRLCIVSKVQREQLHSLKIMESFDNRFTSQVDFKVHSRTKMIACHNDDVPLF